VKSRPLSSAERVPCGPVETAPAGWVPASAREEILGDVLAGLELGAYDRRMLVWLAGWDLATVLTVASWLVRARAAGAAPRARPGTGGAR
jgi:hypothetical protein